MDEQKTQRVKLGGLWEHETRSGIKFWTGDLGMNVQIQVWPNKKREGKNDPDYAIWFGEKLKKPKETEIMSFPPNSSEIPF